jgi:hypothetical protein
MAEKTIIIGGKVYPVKVLPSKVKDALHNTAYDDLVEKAKAEVKNFQRHQGVFTVKEQAAQEALQWRPAYSGGVKVTQCDTGHGLCRCFHCVKQREDREKRERSRGRG